VIHNAAFDIEFLDLELANAGLPPIEECCAAVVDSLALARDLHPGKKNSLDALCERYQVDNTHRTLHGALLDAQLLADVYLAMTRGQDSLAIELDAPRAVASLEAGVAAAERPPLVVLAASAEELAAHDAVLAAIDAECKGRCLWKLLDSAIVVPDAAPAPAMPAFVPGPALSPQPGPPPF
jgi:DNA polymerase III subunit epsilon